MTLLLEPATLYACCPLVLRNDMIRVDVAESRSCQTTSGSRSSRRLGRLLPDPLIFPELQRDKNINKYSYLYAAG